VNVLDLLTGTVVRHYQKGDVIPAELRIGFDQLGRLDGEWIWVVEEPCSIVMRRGAASQASAVICGVLVAAPCHGVAMIYRLALMPGTSLGKLTALLRRFMDDLLERGYVGYMTFVDPTVPAQAKLRKLIERAKGSQVGGNHLVMAGPLCLK